MRYLLLVTSAMICPPILAADGSEDTFAIFQAVIDAARGLEHPETGRGSAVVRIDRPTGATLPAPGSRGTPTPVSGHREPASDDTVDFAFKGALSRSALSTVGRNVGEQLKSVWIVGQKCAITYNSSGPGTAIVQPNPPLQFYRQIGYDFNPATFLQHHGKALPELLERVLKGPATLSTTVDAEGILHLIADYKSPIKQEHTIISVDPAKGYRLTATLSSGKYFAQPDKDYTEFLKIEWSQYDSSWYVKAAHSFMYAGVHSWEDESSLAVADRQKSIDVTITEFRPNVDIEDSAFMLSGLQLPAGTRVVDRITDVVYRVGQAPLATDVLEEPLAQSAFAEKVRRQRPNQGGSTGEEPADANDKRAISGMEAKPGMATNIFRSGTMGIGILVFAISFSGGMLFLIARHRARRGHV